jgi:hypothetical protein
MKITDVFELKGKVKGYAFDWQEDAPRPQVGDKVGEHEIIGVDMMYHCCFGCFCPGGKHIQRYIILTKTAPKAGEDLELQRKT